MSLPSLKVAVFFICLCFSMVSFRGKKKAWVTPRSVSFRGLIQNFQRASPPLSYASPPPREQQLHEKENWNKHQNFSYIGLLKGLSLPPNLSCPDSFLPPNPPPAI